MFSPFCASKDDFLLISAGADLFLDNFFYNAGLLQRVISREGDRETGGHWERERGRRRGSENGQDHEAASAEQRMARSV